MPNTIKASLWMLVAVASFTIMAVAGREAGSELDTFELMMYRSIIGLLVVLIVCGFAGTLQTISRARLGMHFIRNVCHFFGQNLWFFALTVIPLAQVFAFEFSTPIWVALLAPIVIAAALCAIGFAGTFIATKVLSKTESITCILFWLASMQLVFGTIFSAYDGDITKPSASTIPFIALVGICGLLAHFSPCYCDYPN